MQPVEKLSYDENSSVKFNTIKRLETEIKWIKFLPSASPVDFNDNIYQERNISKMPDFGVSALLEIRKRKPRSQGKRQKGNDKRNVLHTNLPLPLLNYQQSQGNTVNIQSLHFLVPFPSWSYTFWILRLIGFKIGIIKCMRMHF